MTKTMNEQVLKQETTMKENIKWIKVEDEMNDRVKLHDTIDLFYD